MFPELRAPILRFRQVAKFTGLYRGTDMFCCGTASVQDTARHHSAVARLQYRTQLATTLPRLRYLSGCCSYGLMKLASLVANVTSKIQLSVTRMSPCDVSLRRVRLQQTPPEIGAVGVVQAVSDLADRSSRACKFVRGRDLVCD
jgi:hypothetical protein